MSQSNYVVDTLISAKSIAARIEDLAKEIELEFKGTDKLIVVGLLRGSFVFIADLVRELNLPVEVDFLEASSYGDEMVSSKEVRILKDLRGAIEGKDVLLVEDIVDTGHTIEKIISLLNVKKPNSVEICTLLYKPAAFKGTSKPTYVGFDIPNAFVVGYGLDYNEKGRNLDALYQIRENKN